MIQIGRLISRNSHVAPYKTTILLPQTSFTKHPKCDVDKWASLSRKITTDLYSWQRESRKESPLFVLADGPPFANGQLHIGHFLNKTLKDMAIRTALVSGQRVEMRPGWDCHGLAIEQQVLKNGTSTDALRHECRTLALDSVQSQEKDMRDWGLIADYEHPYLTMDCQFEADQLEMLAEMVRNGLVYRGLRPVHWSPSSKTALAEAELEYFDRVDSAAFVAFDVAAGDGASEKLLIWTTTPWTLPANQAIAFNPSIKYCRVRIKDGLYIVSEASAHRLSRDLQWDCAYVDAVSNLSDYQYRSAINGRTCPVLPAEFVTDSAGTGLVHIAPAYGHDDFDLGRKHSIEPESIIDDSGFFTCSGFDGVHMFSEEANDRIFEKLGSNLVKSHMLSHSCPHDWRTKKPVVTRATMQWFINVESMKSALERVIRSDIEMKPLHGKERFIHFISSRDSWCISRQRHWGLPIPAFFTEEGEPVLAPDIIKHVAKIFRENGSSAWWTMQVKDLLPDDRKHCHLKLRKGTDTIDVWFDSGTAWTTTGKSAGRVVAIEGEDQYRGWFQSSLITSVAARHIPAHQTIVCHGFVLDGEMKKMSKSLGNVVCPRQAARKYGIDPLRIWVASSNYHSNIPFSEKLIESCKEQYLKLRNTFKFILGNIHDYDPEFPVKVESESARQFDQLALDACKMSALQSIRSYRDFKFKEGYESAFAFISVLLSPLYLDGIKDRLYVHGRNSLSRRSAQQTLYQMAICLGVMLSPITPLLISEVSEHLKVDIHKLHVDSSKQSFSVHGAKVGVTMQSPDAPNSVERLQELLILKRQVLKEVPLSRCQASFPSCIKETFTEECLLEALQISSVSFSSTLTVPKFQKTAKSRCERCWAYRCEDDEHVCSACRQVLSPHDFV